MGSRKPAPPLERQIIHHHGDLPFMQCSNAMMTAATYHPAAEIERLSPVPYSRLPA